MVLHYGGSVSTFLTQYTLSRVLWEFGCEKCVIFVVCRECHDTIPCFPTNEKSEFTIKSPFFMFNLLFNLILQIINV